MRLSKVLQRLQVCRYKPMTNNKKRGTKSDERENETMLTRFPSASSFLNISKHKGQCNQCTNGLMLEEVQPQLKLGPP